MVDERIYNEFVEFVIEKRGQKRGVLGTEVENALKEYMIDEPGSEDLVEAKVSNEDLMRELRAISSEFENTPAPVCTSEGGQGNDPSTGAEATSPSSPGGDKGSKNNTPGSGESSGSGGSGEFVRGIPVPESKPRKNAPYPERVAWIMRDSNVYGHIPFSVLRELVSDEYDFSDKTERKVAWKIAEVLAPDSSNLPHGIEIDSEDFDGRRPKLDSELQAEATLADSYKWEFPRRNKNGAWFTIDRYSDQSINHQEPTERGDVNVFVGELGARACCRWIGIENDWTSVIEVNINADADTDTATDADTDTATDADTDTATDADTDTAEAEEEAEDIFVELDNAERGRE